MNNDETGRQIFVYVCDGIKQGLKALAVYYEKFKQKIGKRKDMKVQYKQAMKVEKGRMQLHEPYKGKQTVRQLMQHGQQLNSVDISTDKSLRTFNKIAKKHGVDFAVKKSPDSGKYLIFFKAKDNDVLASVFEDFSKKELNKNSKKESLVDKINQNEKAVSIIHEYIDRAYSAKTDNRPEFQKMIKDSYSKNFQAVIVWKLDRFARNRYDSARYKTILKKNNVEVRSATENISKGAEGIILEAVLEGYAEYYSAELSEKVIRGMTENALKCKFNGGAIPIGYRIDENKHYQIDELVAPYVKDAFQMYDLNITMKEIAEYLNQKGVRTSNKKLINIRCVSVILRNRKYIGEYRYRDVVIPGGVPKIVSEELFNSVQDKLDMKQCSPNVELKCKYILSAKIRCGNCGSIMWGEYGTSHTGVVYSYYKCAAVKKHLGCTTKSVRQEIIEQEVMEKVVSDIFNAENIELISKLIMQLNKKENAVISLLKKQYDCIKKNINNILDAIADGVYTVSVKEKLLELEQQKAELEKQIQNEKDKLNSKKLSLDQIKYWLYNILNLITEDKKSLLIDTFVDEVLYFNDN